MIDDILAPAGLPTTSVTVPHRYSRRRPFPLDGSARTVRPTERGVCSRSWMAVFGSVLPGLQSSRTMTEAGEQDQGRRNQAEAKGSLSSAARTAASPIVPVTTSTSRKNGASPRARARNNRANA